MLSTAHSTTTRFVPLLPLAEGGMGRIDLVLRREGHFERVYALKRLHRHHSDHPGMRKMFLDEARIAGHLRHANIVSVLDVGEDEDGPYLVMDYIEAIPLDVFLQHHVALAELIPLSLCLDIGIQIATGLAAAHAACDPKGTPLSIVHRDVSPSNVLIGFDGAVRVSDFGIAKALGRMTHTASGSLKGKIGYMSPEQLQFEKIDARSDLFSLGIVLFELLAARRLYDGESGPKSILRDPCPDLGEERADAPPALVELVTEMLGKRKDTRPESAKIVSERLLAIRAELPLDGSDSLGTYLGEEFGEQRREVAERIRTALEHSEAGTFDSAMMVRRGSEEDTTTAAPISRVTRSHAPASPTSTAVTIASVLAALIFLGIGIHHIVRGASEDPILNASPPSRRNQASGDLDAGTSYDSEESAGAAISSP